jgi:hydroxymethylpyrimidine/phosphomethylpyrimidine kinase
MDQSLPIALTIAGSDSGGGAGIQADLHTFAALGVHGTCALTSLTAQNPRAVRSVHAVPPRFLREQMESVFEALPPRALKTGMLFSTRLIREVAAGLASRRPVPYVLDPVMVATSGARLLESGAVRALRTRLLPLATLITPNLPETEILLSRTIQWREVEQMRSAARELWRQFGCAVLVKGGHLPGSREAVDILLDGRDEWLLRAPFVRGVSTHGTGCTYSAAITAFLARGAPLVEAVTQAKHYLTSAIARSRRIGRCWALHWSIPAS